MRFDQVRQFRNGRFHVEGLVINHCHQQITSDLDGRSTDSFISRTHCHFVHATHRGTARLAKAGLHTRQILQLDYDVLKNVRRPGPFAHTLHEAATFINTAAMFDQTGQCRVQSRIKPRD